MSTPPSLEERIDKILYRNVGIGYAGAKPHNQNSPKTIKGRAEAQQAIRQLIEDEVRAEAKWWDTHAFAMIVAIRDGEEEVAHKIGNQLEARIDQALAQRETTKSTPETCDVCGGDHYTGDCSW